MPPRSLPDVVDDQPRRRRVAADDPDVEGVAIEGDAHLGLLGCGFAFARLRLDEAVSRCRRAPHLFVERAVERDRRARFLDADAASAVR